MPDTLITIMPHTCHWPHCPVEIPPRLFMCGPHWKALPRALRDDILATYRPGQEVTKDPSVEYIDAVMQVQTWILSQQPRYPSDRAGIPGCTADGLM